MTQIPVTVCNGVNMNSPTLNDGAPHRDRNWNGSFIAAEPLGDLPNELNVARYSSITRLYERIDGISCE